MFSQLAFYLLLSLTFSETPTPSEIRNESQGKAPQAAAASDGAPKFPLTVRISRTVAVKRTRNHRSATMAKVYPGAQLRVKKRGRSQSCKYGWLGRQGGGFICSKHLKYIDGGETKPAPGEEPDLLAGLDAYEVSAKKGPKLYRRLEDLERRRPLITLHKTSTVIVRKRMNHQGKAYFQTRMGWYVEDRHLDKLPPPIDSLGVDIGRNTAPPFGIVIAKNAETYASPDDSSAPTGTLKRWSSIEQPGKPAKRHGKNWFSLGSDVYIDDAVVARYRKAPLPRKLGEHEKWIAIDVKEQLLHAYEGKRLVRLVPCSTGKRGNTAPGNYRIQWKRRVQTMQLRQGHIRVEDVQWVMYYDRRNGIAIHSSYWHDSYGTPVSHGCVNLPHEDARWVFEWTSPQVLPVDSERFPTPKEAGSRVVVFKK